MYKIHYFEKLYSVFSDESKFTELKSDVTEKEVLLLRKLIRSLKIIKNSAGKIISGYINTPTWHSIQPRKRCKKAYGLIKMHKTGKFRPIVTGFDTPTSGIEKYLKNILQKLVLDNSFSVASTKDFKAEFAKNKFKYDKNKHVFVSFDAVSLYTNVNVERTIEFVIDKLYENPELLQQYQNSPSDEPPVKLSIIPKSTLKSIFIDVLLKFNTFRAGEKIYSQKSGLVMGNSLSPILANIFCYLMEKQVILPKYNKSVMFYCRYVDDVFAILDKNVVESLLSEMNNFDPSLTFTLERADPTLSFLDTEIYLDNINNLQHKHFRKEIASSVLHNFSSAISPKKYLISTLCTEIYRHNSSNSNAINLDNSLCKLKHQFLNNSYPEKLIDAKINEIKNRNFEPKPKKINFANIEFSAKSTLCLPFTSKRCSQVERKLLLALKSVTPDYYLTFAWTLIRIGRVITPHLKPFDNHKINCCYEFKCECGSSYIGETSRDIKDRVTEHGQLSKNTEVSSHIHACQQYLSARTDFNMSSGLSETKSKFKFLMEHFSVLETNLNYHDRMFYESIEIAVHRPELNKQKSVKKLNLF